MLWPRDPEKDAQLAALDQPPIPAPELAPQDAGPQQLSYEPPAQAPPDAQPDPRLANPEPDPFAQFAAMGPQDYSQPPAFDLPPPPMKEKPSEGPAILGMILNLAMNRGRQVPQMLAQFGQPDDTDYENWKRQAGYAKDRYALTAPRRGQAGGLSPMQAALQMERLRQGKERLGLGVTGEQRKAQALKDAQSHWAAQHDPESSESKGYADIAIQSGVDPKMVEGKSAVQIQKLAPSINFGAERTGALGQADTSHAAEKAGAEAAATEASKIRIAEAGALAQAGARGDEMERARLAQLTATRNIGEAELRKASPILLGYLHDRKGGALGAKLTPDAALLDKNSYNVTKQQVIDAATKMVTGGAPHESEIRAQLQNLPNYEDINAEEKMSRILDTILQLGAAGGTALQETKEAPRPIRRPNANQPGGELGTTPAIGPKVKDVVGPQGPRKKYAASEIEF